jgi:hypothetical protein
VKDRLPTLPQVRYSADIREFWMKTVRLEYNTLVRMGCWDIVDIPSDTILLGVRWVFKIKMIENEYERHKVSLVVKGYMKQEGVHYRQSFSATISGFLAYCHGIDKYERIQILGFGCDIGLCVSATV